MPTKNIIDCDLKKLADIIDYNENALGFNKNIHSGSLLNIKDELFYLVNFFSCIDKSFKNELLQQLFNDSLHFLDIYTQIENTNVETICEQDGLQNEYKSKLKAYKLKVISILNTRLYCIDLIMWDLVKQSKKIKRFVNIFEVGNVRNTQEFLKIQKYDLKPMFKSNYLPMNDTIKAQYKEQDIKLLQSLISNVDNEVDEGLEYLLKSKNSICFFEHMSDEEIKLIVSDVKFLKYGQKEIITKQGEHSNEMYYILSGSCTVVQDNQIVGSLSSNQIFGEFSKITNRARFATVVTKEPSTLLSFNLRLELFDEAPFSFSTLYKNILTELVKKIDISNHYKHK